MLQLLFSHPDERIVMKLRDGFGGHPQITARTLTSRQLAKLPNLDALYLTIMAAERWGAYPIRHAAQVLATQSEPGWPPFVIAGVAMANEDPRDPAFELHLIVQAVLKAARQFNSASPRQITTIGLSPEWIGLDTLDPADAGRIIRNAYDEATAG